MPLRKMTGSEIEPPLKNYTPRVPYEAVAIGDPVPPPREKRIVDHAAARAALRQALADRKAREDRWEEYEKRRAAARRAFYEANKLHTLHKAAAQKLKLIPDDPVPLQRMRTDRLSTLTSSLSPQEQQKQADTEVMVAAFLHNDGNARSSREVRQLLLESERALEFARDDVRDVENDEPLKIEDGRDPVDEAVDDVVRSAPETIKRIEAQRAHQEESDKLAADLAELRIAAKSTSPLRDLSRASPWRQWREALRRDADAPAPP